MATLAQEAWTGSDGAAWPAGWTIGGTTGFASFIQNNRGRLTTGTASYATARADNTGMAAASDTDATVTFFPSAIGTGEEGWFFLRVRGDGVVGSQAWTPQNGYQLWIYKDTSNNLQAYVRRYSGNVQTTLATMPTQTGPWSTAGMKARLQAIGGTVRAKVWLASDPEPETWPMSASDGAPLAAGRIGIITTKGTTAVARSMDFDDLLVTDGDSVIAAPTQGAGAGAWAYSGAGTGSTSRRAAGVATWTFTGDATGASTRRGSGSGAWSVTGAGQGATDRSGSGVGSVTWSGTGTGAAPAIAETAGSGSGSWGFAGTGTGARTSTGSGSGATTWAGTGSGTTPAVSTSIPDHRPGTVTIAAHLSTALLAPGDAAVATLAAPAYATATTVPVLAAAALTGNEVSAAVLNGDGVSAAALAPHAGTVTLHTT